MDEALGHFVAIGADGVNAVQEETRDRSSKEQVVDLWSFIHVHEIFGMQSIDSES
jgi:hypothetical protein